MSFWPQAMLLASSAGVAALGLPTYQVLWVEMCVNARGSEVETRVLCGRDAYTTHMLGGFPVGFIPTGRTRSRAYPFQKINNKQKDIVHACTYAEAQVQVQCTYVYSCSHARMNTLIY